MIAIIDSSGNNLTSVGNALERLGQKFCYTHDPHVVQNATHVILPGVGSAQSGMNALKASNLDELLPTLKQPVLGICLGMQLLFDYSEENETTCLGIIPGKIRKIPLARDLPVPHMGWNQLQWERETALRASTSILDYYYFVHSYAYLEREYSLARCQYSSDFTAIVAKDNFLGMQFHPEKSSACGSALLLNFLEGGASW